MAQIENPFKKSDKEAVRKKIKEVKKVAYVKEDKGTREAARGDKQ